MELPVDLKWNDIRTIVAHDWLVTWAGAERCLEEILKVVPRADVVVGLIKDEIRGLNEVTKTCHETWLGRIPGARRHHRWFVPLELVAFRSVSTEDYDLTISSSHAFAKAIRAGRRGIHVCYCHSPPRYLWDLFTTYRREAPFLASLALRLARLPLQYADRYSASGVTHFVANSQFVAARIRRYYGRDARVVYPPVSIKGAVTTVSRHRDRFLLYIGRLVPYKRVHLLVAAANRLGLRLIVAGDGPDRLRLERIADRNTEFLGHVDEATAAELLSRCALFVFAAQEDFGIAPVEANAHGVPVVAFAGGAIAETMVAGVTAELFREPTADSVKDAVLRALSRSWDEETLRANAERFSPLRFRKAFAGVLNAALSGERW